MTTQLRLRILGIAVLLLVLAPSWLVAQESEPNDSCLSPQIENAETLPVVLNGSLDSTESFADVDFYRFAATPGVIVQVDLEGNSTGAGTLHDPFLGWFDGDCALQALDDDGGVHVNARSKFAVPDNGVFVVGVTDCCDTTFAGGGEGSYTLTLDVNNTVGSIFGTLVDAETLAALPGDAPPHAYLYLYRCTEFDCGEFMGISNAGSDGSFNFSSNYAGESLPIGTYRLEGGANGYEWYVSDQFDVGQNEYLDLGALQLTPVHAIGTVTGRLVDTFDGTPLGGSGPPFAGAFLAYCEDDFCNPFNFAPADEMGRFQFEGAVFFAPLGEYAIVGQADGYIQGESQRLNIGRNENVDFGDVSLTPIPVLIGDMDVCEITEGSDCEYGFDISVRAAKQLKIAAWSLVRFYPTSDPFLASEFQVGRQGADSPSPQEFNLKSGAQQSIRFKVRIPDQVSDDFTVCTTIYIGQLPQPQLDMLVSQTGFCAYKQNGVLGMMSDKEARKFLREKKLR